MPQSAHAEPDTPDVQNQDAVEPAVAEETLVEEVSIDGMCGVY
jgi:mycofactocin precursor